MATEEKEILIGNSIEMTTMKTSIDTGISVDEKEGKEKDESIKNLIKKVLQKDIGKIKILEEKRFDLEMAMREGIPEMVNKLLDEGAPIQTYVQLGNGSIMTTLTFATQFDRKDIFCLILARAINEEVDFEDLFIKTAMQKACIKNSVLIARILMKMELDYENIHDLFSREALDVKNTGHSYDDPNASYLHICAFHGSCDVLELLLKNTQPGNEIGRVDSRGNTPIHLACRIGHSKCVNVLISKGASIDIKNNVGRTPLFTAIFNASDDFILHLLRQGASANEADNLGMTPFLSAAENGRDSIFSSLINYGAEIDSKNAQEQTPLMMACKAGSASTIKDLLFRGASIDAKDKNGADAFAIARKEKQDEALSLIVRMRREENNFNYLGWHRVLKRGLYKSILTMLDCLIEPQLDKNQVKLDFTVLEMDSNNVTPDDYWEYEKRKSSLLQRFAATDNEEIAYHGVTRILVNEKFKKYGNLLLWFKTLFFISFLFAMVYALVQAAQEHRNPQTLYSSNSGWDILRYFCELYVVLFWMSNIVTESAEVIQVIFYANKDISDRKEEQKLKSKQEEDLKLKDGVKDNGGVKSKPVVEGDAIENETLLQSIQSDEQTIDIALQSKTEGMESDSARISAKSDRSDNSEQSLKSEHSLKSHESVDSNVSVKSDQKSDNLNLSEKSDHSKESDEKAEGSFDEDILDDSDTDSDYWREYYYGNEDYDYDYDDSDDDQADENKDDDDVLYYDDDMLESDKKDSRFGRLKAKIDKKYESIINENIFVRVLLDYFHDWYNWLDIIGLLLIFILIVYRIIILTNLNVLYVEFQWIFATFAFAINAFRLTKLLNVFRIMGTYLRIIILILLKDVPKFLLLLFLTFIFFSTTLYLSYRVPIIIGESNSTNGTNNTIDYYITLFDLPNLKEEGFDRYYYTLLYPLRVLLEGNALEFNYLFNSFNIVAAGVYIVFLFLIIVVYLNVFIAQLSDTYAGVKENAEKTVAKFRLDFIVQTQTTSLLALFFDFRERYYQRRYIMRDGEWVKYFNASISRLDDDDFTTQDPSESVLALVNKVQHQQERSIRTQECLQTDTEAMKKTMRALEIQNKVILEKVIQLAQK